jgi:hypothetical protein
VAVRVRDANDNIHALLFDDDAEVLPLRERQMIGVSLAALHVAADDFAGAEVANVTARSDEGWPPLLLLRRSRAAIAGGRERCRASQKKQDERQEM